MYKTVNFRAGFSASTIGTATRARIRVIGEQVQVRFTDRTSTVNMPKGEMLRDLGVKGSGRRLGLPSEIGAILPDAGTPVALIAGKYGWFTVETAMDAGAADASISK